jgi:hypothetical protein
VEGFADLECVDVGGAFSLFFISKIKRMGGWGVEGFFFFFLSFIRESGFWVIGQSGKRMTGVYESVFNFKVIH